MEDPHGRRFDVDTETAKMNSIDAKRLFDSLPEPNWSTLQWKSLGVFYDRQVLIVTGYMNHDGIRQNLPTPMLFYVSSGNAYRHEKTTEIMNMPIRKKERKRLLAELENTAPKGIVFPFNGFAFCGRVQFVVSHIHANITQKELDDIEKYLRFYNLETAQIAKWLYEHYEPVPEPEPYNSDESDTEDEDEAVAVEPPPHICELFFHAGYCNTIDYKTELRDKFSTYLNKPLAEIMSIYNKRNWTQPYQNLVTEFKAIAKSLGCHVVE